MAKHLPTSVWCLRRGLKPPYIRTHDKDTLLIQMPTAMEGMVANYLVSRRDARLFAKRINECLDATRSR